MAAYADTQGYHRVPESGASPRTLRKFFSFLQGWKALEKFPSREKVEEVGELVLAGEKLLQKIVAEDEDTLVLGDKYLNDEEALNRASFIELTPEGVVIRASASLRVNHLYRSPGGDLGKACVSFNAGTGAITLSFAEEPSSSAIEILRPICGPLSGGHTWVAGSPRGERMTFAQWASVVNKVREALRKE